jgi:cellulose synthase/poly-beta-1,6-N-acetylglucosamine synthase-like glycosyltransferase
MNNALFTLYAIVQTLFLFGLLVNFWFLSRKVDLVDLSQEVPMDKKPPIIMFYPVLNELEETMRTTMTGMAKAKYPHQLLRVIAIPNRDDLRTVDALKRLQLEFNFLELMAVPSTSDPSWEKVFSSWDNNPGAYWWHTGKRAGDTNLPPKKTRQLIWAVYNVADGNPDTLLSYIDADSVVPEDYFDIAAIAIQQYPVVQLTNITGNLLQSWPSSFFAMDHISWDSTLYRHLTDNGRQPYYVLGKGLFVRIADLLEVGGLHPWITIEDPEIGMRLWTNGLRLGIVEKPLIEEVPASFLQGITQRKRWMAGFFQSLGSPLALMGMPFGKRIRARLNFVPCLSLVVTPVGLVVGIWAIVGALTSPTPFISGPLWILSILNLALAATIIIYTQVRAWKMTRPVLSNQRDRLRYLLRVNPVFLMIYWIWWSIPLAIGFWMFLRDTGLEWERTEKIDANHELVLNQPDTQVPTGTNADVIVPEIKDSTDSGPLK